MDVKGTIQNAGQAVQAAGQSMRKRWVSWLGVAGVGFVLYLTDPTAIASLCDVAPPKVCKLFRVAGTIAGCFVIASGRSIFAPRPTVPK